MQIMKGLAIATAVALIISCFLPWVSIEHKNIVVTGLHAEEIRLGKPGLIHVILSSLFLFFLLLNKVWSLRTAFFISTFNIAWAVRNFVVVSSCSGGECPTKHFALYVILIAPVLATVFLLLIEKKVDAEA